MRKVVEKFVCEFCGAEFSTEAKHNKHVLDHDIVYIGLERNEWKALVTAIVFAGYAGAKFPEKTVDKLLRHKLGVTR